MLLEGGGLTVRASTEGGAAECPSCGGTSRRVHGCYPRTLADLPWGGVPVRLRVRVRKFFCDEPTCGRKIFAERLGGVARTHARGTDRRREAPEWIAFALSGEAGARLARELGLLVSPDTLLNRIRGALRPVARDVRVLGVGDFAFRKGNAYGTPVGHPQPPKASLAMTPTICFVLVPRHTSRHERFRAIEAPAIGPTLEDEV